MDAAYSRRLLYPPIHATQTFRLPVSGGHELHVEECGRPDGLPVITLHGGPGGGVSPALRRFFDPRRYRIILFDQRGCGRSTPHGGLENNTTADLIDDIERIRERMGVDKWLVFGGSWGATLAIAYARQHPDRCLGLILRGVFLCTELELNWFYRQGANMLFPDAWERLVDPLAPEERGDIVRAYYERLAEPDIVRRRPDALAWARWESALISMTGDPSAPLADPIRSDALARLETHYFVHKGFLEHDGVLLEDVGRFSHLPGVIVQGRYDMVTPPRSAWSLARAWPRARLQMIGDAGHAAGEPGVVDALVRATDAFADRMS
ncbi:prolyl aminopeptidase [Maricaulis virginensis]|uniref:Proline iminopeptidase n=1 Tax=Maricaulis virginensis TaxID=144022 RepID=A0A9W6ILH4_9PROT|nr:prolyl aminopeptidase [Maricaulis virginensis]GLK51459.1 proline iminopeptidase [Maricaulis virginensis]